MQLKKELIAIGLLISVFLSVAQERLKGHPSTWPDPKTFKSMEALYEYGYTKAKQIEYYKWKKQSLPYLYLIFKENVDGLNYDSTSWKNGYELTFKYSFPALDTSDYLEYRVRCNSLEVCPNQILDFDLEDIDSLDVKDLKWIRNQLIEDSTWLSCNTIDELAREIYIVNIDSAAGKAKINQVSICFSDKSYADDVTDYNLKHKKKSEKLRRKE